jgi:hypothetical protein
MWSYVKWSFWIVFWAVVAAFLHYTLPRYATVRITDTYSQRVDFGENSIFWAHPDTGNATGQTSQDVFFIQAIRPNGRPIVFRNEDTGWGWPPYFKFDTSDLQTSSADLRSTADNPVWVAVRFYGWRNQFITIFPNAVAIERVAGPEVRKRSITTITLLILFGLLVWAIWSRWRKFRLSRIDPLLDDVEGRFDRAQAGASRWWDSWRGPTRR